MNILTLLLELWVKLIYLASRGIERWRVKEAYRDRETERQKHTEGGGERKKGVGEEKRYITRV